MNTFVSTEWLARHAGDGDLIIAEVRWEHRNPAAAYERYRAAHIPGSIYLDLDRELSAPPAPRSGRHPLPDPERVAKSLSQKGVNRATRVICVDDEGGKLAARLWWMLRWLGHERAAILDGGLGKWRAEGRVIEMSDGAHLPETVFHVKLRPELMLEANEVAARIEAGGTVLDARAPERYAGIEEALDARAGHIAGARNLPLTLMQDGDPPQLKDPGQLRALFQNQGLQPAERIAAYCGSGVTACYLLAGLHAAGYQDLSLYPGSWSEWIALHPEAGTEIPKP